MVKCYVYSINLWFNGYIELRMTKQRCLNKPLFGSCLQSKYNAKNDDNLSHTEAATVLRPVFQFSDQIATDRSKVPVRSPWGRGRSHWSPYGRWRSLRNFELLKISCDDFSIGVRSVRCRSAVGLRSHSSDCGRSTIVHCRAATVLDLWSRECTATALRLCGPYCDHKTSVLRQWAIVLRTRSQSVSLSRCTVAVYSL